MARSTRLEAAKAAKVIVGIIIMGRINNNNKAAQQQVEKIATPKIRTTNLNENEESSKLPTILMIKFVCENTTLSLSRRLTTCRWPR